MALTLDPTLATAQDSFDRQPIIELLSTQIEDAIPFNGNYFNEYTAAESGTSLLAGSSGALFCSFIRNNVVYFMYTDTDRNTWSEVVAYTPVSYTVTETSVVELTNGRIAVVFIEYTGTTYRLSYIEVDVTGSVVVTRTTIATFSAGIVISGVYIYRLSDNSYLLTYCHLESDVYSLQMRLTTSFLSWPAQSEISLTGFDTSHEINNTSIVQGDNGDILLCLDYADSVRDDGSDIKNIYLIVSEDGASSWSVPVAITSYADWGTFGAHPDLSIDSSGEVKLTFHEERNVLFANSNTSLWSVEGSCGADYNGTDIHFDPSTNRLYIYQIFMFTGNKSLCGIVVLNTETWEVVRNYTTATSPGYNIMFRDEHVWYHRHKGAAHYVAVSTISHLHCATLLINHNAESITQYYFKNSATYGVSRNVTGLDWRTSIFETYGQIYCTFVDDTNDRLYVVLGYSYVYQRSLLIGYFEIGGGYAFNEVYFSQNVFTQEQLLSLNHACFIPELNSVALSFNCTISSWEGRLSVINLTTGSITYDYNYSNYQGFPYQGVDKTAYYNGHLYSSFPYHSDDGQEDYRGLLDINMAADTMRYHRPTYATIDDYQLGMKKVTDDGRILICTIDYGLVIFDTSSEGWTQYTNTNFPGLEPETDYYFTDVDYDETNDIIFVGSVNYSGYDSFSGVRAFSESGAFTKGKYTLGNYVGSAWTWDAIANLLSSNYGANLVNTVDSGDVLWSIWINRNVTEYSLNWDYDNATLNLYTHLVAGSAITVDYSVDRNNSLNFKLANGHLFDPNNTLSSLSQFTQKGKLITLRFGEKINDVDYYHNQGSYIVNATKITYERGEYPTISVDCEDKRCLLDYVNVVASDRYDNADPEDIITDMLSEFAGYDSEDYSIPSLENSHEIFHQFIDTKLLEAVTDLLDHFGYIPFVDVDDVFTVKHITVDGSVDHDYTSGRTPIISFTPDDNYSSFTNRVTVNGESRDFLEVTYPEEVVKTLSGTGGWWSDREVVIRVHYSDDRQRRCRRPRLSINKSIRDFKILWEQSGGDEYISDEDINEHWVEITIEYPGIMEVLIASIAALVATGYLAVTCDTHLSCGGYMVAFSIMVAGISWILGQVATYDYEVYAQPIGEEKQTVSAYADDEEFQQRLGGQIIEEEIDDPFCYTVGSCQTVANQELDIVMAQRKRISFDKIAHLQDEICDRIQIVHPFNNLTLDVFITNLKRTYIKPERGVSDSGSFTDNITGWIV